jgi:hypothetical protein
MNSSESSERNNLTAKIHKNELSWLGGAGSSFGPPDTSISGVGGGSGRGRRRPSGVAGANGSSNHRGNRKVFIPSPPRCSTPGIRLIENESNIGDRITPTPTYTYYQFLILKVPRDLARGVDWILTIWMMT